MKQLISLLMILMTLLLVGCTQQQDTTTMPVEPVACTEDAKLCPDGQTVVVRTGPNCEFEACPTQEASEGKEYILDDVEKCEVVIFQCDEGFVPFNDELGCGCEPKPEMEESTDVEETDEVPEPAEVEEPTEVVMKHVCTDEEKEALGCTRIYKPVCGYFSEDVNCITEPCANTYSNSCTACVDEMVDYYIEGTCPQPEQAEGDDEFTYCKPEQKGSFCVEIYQPVCGYDNLNNYETFSNGCHACAADATIKYKEGECVREATDSSASTTDLAQFLAEGKGTLCTEDQKNAEVCTMEYMPVCGYDVQGEGTTFGNTCQACSSQDILSWEEGEC